ncbi:hypothetical protein LCGC14_2643320 [marine sediment metagenome]|uniref:Uncharacterized protein n=1 Tax=marine sediment metagenome TaxID=412755 RepID=A0A0F9AJD6_9ZZZZ
MKEATYNLTNGEKLTVEYDETAPCRICSKPVTAASVGGTDVCPWCDMGTHRDGTKWTFGEMMAMIGKEPEKSEWEKRIKLTK